MHIIPISSLSQPEENEMAECGHDIGEECTTGGPHQSHQLSKVWHLEDKPQIILCITHDNEMTFNTMRPVRRTIRRRMNLAAVDPCTTFTC